MQKVVRFVAEPAKQGEVGEYGAPVFRNAATSNLGPTMDTVQALKTELRETGKVDRDITGRLDQRQDDSKFGDTVSSVSHASLPFKHHIALETLMAGGSYDGEFGTWQQSLVEGELSALSSSISTQQQSTSDAGDTLITGLEENLADIFGMQTLVDVVDSQYPQQEQDQMEPPLVLNLGAYATSTHSEPEQTMKSSSLPLTLEQYQEVLRYKVPRFRHEILKLPLHVQRLYFEAERREVHVMEHVYKTVKRIPRSEVPPEHQVFRSTFAFACKSPCGKYPSGRVRARACAVAVLLKLALSMYAIYSPTGSMRSVRVMAAIGAQLMLDWLRWDADNAFANCRRDEPFYMEVWKGHEDKENDTVLEVGGNMQGTPDAPRIWNKRLSSEFVKYQHMVRMVEADYEMYIRFQVGLDQLISVNGTPKVVKGTGELIVIFVHVDDVASADTPGSGAARRMFFGKMQVTEESESTSAPDSGPSAELPDPGMPQPDTPAPGYVGPICRSNGGLPFNSMAMDGLVGLDFNIGKGYVELSLKSYCVKAASHIFGQHPSDINSPATPMEKGDWLTTADCPRTDAEQADAEADDPFEYLVWYGKLSFAVQALMFPLLVVSSNCGRVAKRPSKQGRVLLKRACKWAFGKTGYAFSVLYSKQEDSWYIFRVLASADAAPPARLVTEQQLLELDDKKLASSRLGGMITFGGGYLASICDQSSVGRDLRFSSPALTTAHGDEGALLLPQNWQGSNSALRRGTASVRPARLPGCEILRSQPQGIQRRQL
jgi:hypothetical protein